MKKVIIFGTEQLAELANYYLNKCSDDQYDIVATISIWSSCYI